MPALRFVRGRPDGCRIELLKSANAGIAMKKTAGAVHHPIFGANNFDRSARKFDVTKGFCTNR